MNLLQSTSTIAIGWLNTHGYSQINILEAGTKNNDKYYLLEIPDPDDDSIDHIVYYSELGYNLYYWTSDSIKDYVLYLKTDQNVFGIYDNNGNPIDHNFMELKFNSVAIEGNKYHPLFFKYVHRLIRNNSVGAIKKIMKIHDPNIIYNSQYRSNNIFHNVVKSEIFEYFIKLPFFKQSMIKKHNNLNQTMIHLIKDPAIVSILIYYDMINKSDVTAIDMEGNCCLHYFENIKIVKMLYEHQLYSIVDLNLKNFRSVSVLSKSIINGTFPYFREILNNEIFDISFYYIFPQLLEYDFNSLLDLINQNWYVINILNRKYDSDFISYFILNPNVGLDLKMALLKNQCIAKYLHNYQYMMYKCINSILNEATVLSGLLFYNPQFLLEIIGQFEKVIDALNDIFNGDFITTVIMSTIEIETKKGILKNIGILKYLNQYPYLTIKCVETIVIYDSDLLAFIIENSNSYKRYIDTIIDHKLNLIELGLAHNHQSYAILKIRYLH